MCIAALRARVCVESTEFPWLRFYARAIFAERLHPAAAQRRQANKSGFVANADPRSVNETETGARALMQHLDTPPADGSRSRDAR